MNKAIVRIKKGTNFGDMIFQPLKRDIKIRSGTLGIVDPHEYGGVTPAGLWLMCQPIQKRANPTTGKIFEMACLFPMGDPEWHKEYSARGFEFDNYPFLIHTTTYPYNWKHGNKTSTGCIVFKPTDWKLVKQILNEQFYNCGLILETIIE